MYSGCCSSRVTHMSDPERLSLLWEQPSGGAACLMEKHCILCVCFPWVYHSLKLAWQGNSSVLRRRKSMAHHPQLRDKCSFFGFGLFGLIDQRSHFYWCRLSSLDKKSMCAPGCRRVSEKGFVFVGSVLFQTTWLNSVADGLLCVIHRALVLH